MRSEADEHLLSLIRAGDDDGWRQFIDRFQRRLLAFAAARVGTRATAEDLVQDTFVPFLKSIANYRQKSELETYLFQILRRRIVDHYRSNGKAVHVPVCLPSDHVTSETPEVIAIIEESDQSQLLDLAEAIRVVTSRLRDERLFRDLMIAEGIFYAGRKNRELAIPLECDAKEIAVIKHRLLQRIIQSLPEQSKDAQVPSDTLLTRAWESQRPSCPKRTTLGKYTLGLLPKDWTDYIDFHVKTLGCTFCTANLTELGDIAGSGSQRDTTAQLFQSTIGFLTRIPGRETRQEFRQEP